MAAAARGLVLFNDRDADGSPRLDVVAGEALRLRQAQVGIALDNAPLQEPGTLYVTTKRLVWLSDTNSPSYAVDFLSLAMHAISRDPESYPMPCIYTQIEPADGSDNEDEDGVEPSNLDAANLSRVQEMRLVPSDASVLDNLFKVLCECALLNPDPEGEPEGEADWFFNEHEVLGNTLGQSNGTMDHEFSRISELQIDDERFDDADELEEEGDH